MQKVFTEEEILQTLGNELKKIGVTCAMAVHARDQKLLTIKYTSMSAEALERVENSMGLPFLGYTFSLDLLPSTLTAEDLTKPSVIKSAADRMQLFFAAQDETARLENKSTIEMGHEITFFRLPLLFEETQLGILWIWSTFLTDIDLPVMSNFALQIANALKRAQLFEEIQHLALTDPLTGVQNRRSLFDLGRIELARSQRMDRPFCCLMLDLDHFKKINDTYGHPIGDLVVREFAQCCKRSVREVDLIGRYGGEEIVIFLPETDADTAMQVAERVRKAVERVPIKISDQELHITVSIGVSRADEHTLELETLIARADQAMYVAKHKGRNRVAMSK